MKIKNLVKIGFVETYNVHREVVIEMNDEEYKEYYNGAVPLDNIIRHSKDINDFQKYTNEYEEPKFRIIDITSNKKAFKNKQIENFELEYINNG